MNEERGGGFLAGFAVGALTGAILAYLLTQEEMRDVILGKAREVGNLAMDTTGDLRANAADLYARGKTIVENARTNVDAAVAEGQSQAQRTRDDLSRSTQSSPTDL